MPALVVAEPAARYLTAEQVAEVLQIGVATVYDMWAQGTLPCTKVVRGKRIRQSDLDAWLEQRTTREAAA